MNIDEFERHLKNDIIPFWNRLRDNEYGGFYGEASGNGVANPKAVKGAIYNSRILWFYSEAFLTLGDESLLENATHMYEFMTKYCIDREYGGVYWSVNYDGTVNDAVKHCYNQTFAIYALSNYYAASGNKEALAEAMSLFNIIEEKCRDAEGYLESFKRDFTDDRNDKLSENNVIAERTMNTLLHVLECYTLLYSVSSDIRVRDSLILILEYFRSHIYDSKNGQCKVFFDKEYNPIIDLDSYGHDIEASWLITKACDVLGDDNISRRMYPVIMGLAKGALERGIDRKYMAMNNECENGVLNTKKVWWAQAEAVTGFYNAYELNNSCTEYRDMSENVWNFIKQYVIDSNTGEWVEDIYDADNIDYSQRLAHPWKGPYHNGRMCMEMIRRMSKQEPVNKNASENAVRLLNYLKRTEGKGIISGQHTQTVPMEEIAYIKENTGKEPLLRGFELLSYSPNINYDDASEACITEIIENRNTVEEAYKWGKQGGIVTFSFHWYSPVGGRDKSFYAENTDFDPSNVLIEGTKEREVFYSDMRVIAELLQPFKDADIPVLWRPFHESDGTWFWWGRKGPEVAMKLYILMFDYFVNECGLNNLLWVWNCRLKEGYPGDEYVDVISVDIYLEKYAKTDYHEEYTQLIENTTKNKVAALAEIGYLPDSDMITQSKVPFTYFMTWSKEFCIGEQYNSTQNLKNVYNNPYVITFESGKKYF